MTFNESDRHLNSFRDPGLDPKDHTVVVQRDCASTFITDPHYMAHARMVVDRDLNEGFGYNCATQTFDKLKVCTCTSDMCNYQVRLG